MKKNRLGKSSLYVSEVSLGCMSLGTDATKAVKIIDQAVDLGINFLDTADLYDYGLNEEIVGKAIKGKRDKMIIGTKVGNRWTASKDGWSWDPRKSYIKEEVKQSLKRLGSDYIDLYQLHGGTIDDPIDETIEAFEELKQEGHIRSYGISSIRPNVIREYVKRSNVDSVMMQYNILDRRPEEEILSHLAKNNISVIARGPIAKGLLTNQWQQKLTEKVKNSGYLDYTYKELTEIIPKLEEVSNEKLTSTALRYCLTHPTIATAILGASNVDQVYENIDAFNQSTLSKEQYINIQAITKANVYDNHR